MRDRLRADVIYCYCFNILKKPWIEAEQYMINKCDYEKEYRNRFYDGENLNTIRMKRDISNLFNI
jgi:hypothetical protein